MKVEEPASTGKKARQAVGSPGNVIDRRAMNWMNDPEQSNKKSSSRYRRPSKRGCRVAFRGRRACSQVCQEPEDQEIEQDGAAHVPEKVRKVVAKRAAVPQEIIDAIRNVLD